MVILTNTNFKRKELLFTILQHTSPPALIKNVLNPPPRTDIKCATLRTDKKCAKNYEALFLECFYAFF